MRELPFIDLMLSANLLVLMLILLLLLNFVKCYRNLRVIKLFKLNLKKLTILPESNIKNFPPVSIICPMKDETELAAGCLDSLLAQNYPAEFEILICLPDEYDLTNQVIKKYGKIPFVSVIYSHESGKAIQMHFAVSKAKYDIIAIQDADSRVPEGWLRNMVTILSGKNLECLSGGPFIKKLDPLSIAQQFDLFLKIPNFALYDSLWSGNVLMYRDTYYSFGGLGNISGISIDFELNKRTSNLNIKKGVTLNKDTMTEIIPKKSIRELFWQRVRWASTSHFTKNYFFTGGIYMILLFLPFIMFLSSKIIYFILFLILLIIYYLLDVFFIKKISDSIDFSLPGRGALYYFMIILIQMTAFYAALIFLITGLKWRWKAGKHKG